MEQCTKNSRTKKVYQIPNEKNEKEVWSQVSESHAANRECVLMAWFGNTYIHTFQSG